MEHNQIKTLIDLGLSINEAKTYLALLEAGPSSPTQIAQVSKIHRVNVYDSLKKLKIKHLINEVMHHAVKSYQASPPQYLQNLLEKRRIKLNQIMPELELLGSRTPQHASAQIFEGNDFIRNLFLQFIQKEEDIYATHLPPFTVKGIGIAFQNTIHKRRAEQKQSMFHIYSKKAKKRITFLNKLPLTEARFLDNDNPNNVASLICGDEVALVIYPRGDEKKPLIIMIKNKQVADAHRHDFKVLWNLAKYK